MRVKLGATGVDEELFRTLAEAGPGCHDTADALRSDSSSWQSRGTRESKEHRRSEMSGRGPAASVEVLVIEPPDDEEQAEEED